MIKEIKYPAINAKMKGMYAKDFGNEEIDELLSQSDLYGAISFLKSKFKSLENLKDDANRREIEKALNTVYINEILKVFRYLNKSDREYLTKLLLRQEILCLKNIFRNLVTNRDVKKNMGDVSYLTQNLFTNIDGINEVTSRQEFYEVIKNEEYAKIFKDYIEEDEVLLDELEVRLDKYYYEKVFELAKGNKILEKLIGEEIDLNNLSWIVRSKKFFGYTKEEIEILLVPIYYNLSKKKTDKLLLAETYDELKQELTNTKYKNVLTEEASVEHDIDSFMYREYKKIFTYKIFDISTVYVMINMMHIDFNNIINIIEGIRYSRDTKQIQKKLIM